jgi:hypothetical protein
MFLFAAHSLAATSSSIYESANVLATPVKKAHDIFAKQKIERPIECYTQFLFASREFAEVNRSP